MKLFIIRHGDKENDEFDSNLTIGGREQVQKISNILKEHNLSRIYTSSNPRSIQTGEIISNEINLPFKTISSLKELPRDIFFKSELEWNDENRDLINNIKEFMNDLIKRDEDVVLAMHAGFNRAVISILLNIPLEKTIHFTQDIGCINQLEFKEIYGKKRWCVKLLNSTHHLK